MTHAYRDRMNRRAMLKSGGTRVDAHAGYIERAHRKTQAQRRTDLCAAIKARLAREGRLAQ